MRRTMAALVVIALGGLVAAGIEQSLANLLLAGAGAVIVPATTFDPARTDGTMSLSGGNLIATMQTSNVGFSKTISNTSHASGGTSKWHFEFTATTINSDGLIVGIADTSTVSGQYCGQSPHGAGVDTVASVANDLLLYQNGASVRAYPSTAANGYIYAVEIDVTAGLVWWNVWNGTTASGWTNGTAATFTGAPASGTAGFPYTATPPIFICTSGNTASVVTLNAGGSGFAIAPSSGFSAWGH